LIENNKYLAYFNAVFRRNASELRKIGDFWGQKKVKKAQKGQKNGQKVLYKHINSGGCWKGGDAKT